MELFDPALHETINCNVKGIDVLCVQIVHDTAAQHPVSVADSSSDPEQLGCHSQSVLYVNVCRLLLRNDYLSDSGT